MDQVIVSHLRNFETFKTFNTFRKVKYLPITVNQKGIYLFDYPIYEEFREPGEILCVPDGPLHQGFMHTKNNETLFFRRLHQYQQQAWIWLIQHSLERLRVQFPDLYHRAEKFLEIFVRDHHTIDRWISLIISLITYDAIVRTYKVIAEEEFSDIDFNDEHFVEQLKGKEIIIDRIIPIWEFFPS